MPKRQGFYNASASSTHVHSGSTGNLENDDIAADFEGASPVLVIGTMEFGFDQHHLMSCSTLQTLPCLI
jgi:hypothetical protein